MWHYQRGSYRRDRHGPLPGLTPGSNVVAMPTPPATWAPDAADLVSLPAAGRGFVERMTGSYSFGTAEGAIVIEAAHAVDRLWTLREAAEPSPRVEAMWMRLLASLVGQLKVEV